MKSRMLKIIILFAIIFISTACASSGSTEPNTPHQLQEWVEVGDYDVYVYEIIDPLETEDGYRWIAIEVGYENNRSNEELSCRRNQWVLYDTDGYSYDPEYWSGNLLEEHKLQEFGGERFLNKGTNLRGWLIFEVPENANVNRVQFINQFLITDTADFIIP